jgi:protein-tyrosine kinase
MEQSSIMDRILPASGTNSMTVHATANPERNMKLGEILVTRGRITPVQVERILVEQKNSKLRFGEIAIKLGFARPKDVEEALAQQFGYSRSDVSTSLIPPKLVAALNPTLPFAEALRGLRSQLMLRWFDGSPGQAALAVTSVDRGDGKSFITANLAVVFAQLGERTLVIDADLRHPTQHQIFGVENRMGLSGLLGGRAGLEEISQVASMSNLSVLPSGPLPPNPQELLGRQDFAEMLNQLSTMYDVILVDTPSAQEASDASVIAQRVRAALIVGRKDRTRSSELNQLAAIMTSSGIQILGATLNSF